MGDIFPNCVDCGGPNKTQGCRCPTCYVKFALDRRVRENTIKEVLERIKREDNCDISEALGILEEVE